MAWGWGAIWGPRKNDFRPVGSQKSDFLKTFCVGENLGSYGTLLLLPWTVKNGFC